MGTHSLTNSGAISFFYFFGLAARSAGAVYRVCLLSRRPPRRFLRYTNHGTTAAVRQGLLFVIAA